MTTLARSNLPADDDRGGLLERVAQLEAILSERHAEFAQAKSDLDAFEIDYRKRVGTLHEKLDQLELAIAEAELGEISKRLPTGAGGSSGPVVSDRPPSAPRLTSDAVRALFRDVAKAIHPDLALDESTRDRRHALMVEANRAYASGDEEQLRQILQAWERSPEAVPGNDPEATRLRLARRVVQIEEHLAVLARDGGTGGLSARQVENDGGRGSRERQGSGARHDRTLEARHPGRHQSSGRDATAGLTLIAGISAEIALRATRSGHERAGHRGDAGAASQ